MWGEGLASEEDVFDVFERFVRGYVPRLPWCERIENETSAGTSASCGAPVNACECQTHVILGSHLPTHAKFFGKRVPHVLCFTLC